MTDPVAGPGPRYRWQSQSAPPADHLQAYPDIDPLVVQILYHRGVREADSMHRFLAGDAGDDNPFRLRGVAESVARIREAIRRQEPIAVYGDFDVDGVTATALLVGVLESLGGRVVAYIPHRQREGYGLNVAALDRLADQGVRVVVSVDCGVRAVSEINHAARRGLDMIITDHHTPPDQLPPAYALINPRQPGCDYGFKALPGVGLAYKLAQALLRVQRNVPLPTTRSAVDEESLLDLVALGTVADLAPLQGENRALVRRGLAVLNQAERVGVQALLAVAQIQPGHVSADTIAFVLGPRLNAAGRLADAKLAYELLSTRDPERARELAAELDARNRERQQLTEEALTKVLDEIAGHENDYFLMAGSEDIAPGVVGLVASRLTEQFYRPSLVLHIGDEVSHGSARSIEEFVIIDALTEVADLFTRYGGHAHAAGLTIPSEHLDILRERLLAIATRELADVDLTPRLDVDADWPLGQLKPSTFQALTQLEPFGKSNPPPLLLARDVALREYRAVGETGDHLWLKLEHNRVIWDAMAFGQGHWAADMPERIDIVYTPKIEEWEGQLRLRLEVEDLRPTGRQVPEAVEGQ
jgi:single-stranded-DNA-specific exonuclease